VPALAPDRFGAVEAMCDDIAALATHGFIAVGRGHAFHAALDRGNQLWSSTSPMIGTVWRRLRRVARLNDMITAQAAIVAVIDQFKIVMTATLIVSHLVLFLRKPRRVSLLVEPMS
jgi:hypothetical protein